MKAESSFKIEPALKMSIFSPAIFGDLKAAAEAKKATGAEIIDLSLGSPDLPPDEKVRQVLSEQSALASTYGIHLAVQNDLMKPSRIIINGVPVLRLIRKQKLFKRWAPKKDLSIYHLLFVMKGTLC